jgi:hypothetical protein
MADLPPDPSPSEPAEPSSAEPSTAGSAEPGAAERRRRRRRLAEVFGDVLPDQTSDDTDPSEAEDAGEEWLRRQVPPHHG